MSTKLPESQAESHPVSGMNEVSLQQFMDKLKSEPPESILDFDLKLAFPTQATSTGVLPKLDEKIWRRVMDETMAEFGGAYAHSKGTPIIKVWFEKLPAGAAKAKLPTLAERMKDVSTKAHHEDRPILLRHRV